MHEETSVVRVGVLGCGNVGAALVTLLADQAASIEARSGLRLELARVAVRNLAKSRSVQLAEGILTHDAQGVVDDPDIDVVVELVGGIEPARSLVLDALKSGKPVVTANKELVANVGAELFAAADAAGVDLLFEAAVAGAIPVVRPLRESLAGTPIRRITGIVNGTTNYILSRMSEQGATYADALAEAQSLGYAERDPTADVEGFDAGAKVAILATIAFGTSVVAGDVSHEGISGVTPADIAFAHRLGYEVKLLAVAEHGGDGRVAVRVHPAMVPRGHPLASVRGSFNAVFIEADTLGELMLYGRGAGGLPTASAVLGDVVDAAGNRRRGTYASIGAMPRAVIRPIDEVSSEYCLHLEVLDRPGVLHAVSGVFAEHGVSIRSMEQEGLGDEARLIFITHEAAEASVQATLASLRGLDVVDRVRSVIRVVA
ncbi:MAG: homoserine dehydrogenase [Actinobacteria bacterium]|nr:homoserine dehydrogenase [Actinomycetota bacterium]